MHGRDFYAGGNFIQTRALRLHLCACAADAVRACNMRACAPRSDHQMVFVYELKAAVHNASNIIRPVQHECEIRN
eukprot:6199054-Pleurochrysis_carterae.AAC.1